VQAKLKLIDGGKVQQLLLNLRTYLGRGSANITSKGSARLSRLCNYLQRFSDCVDYNRFIELGLPIGSGRAEAQRQQRLNWQWLLHYRVLNTLCLCDSVSFGSGEIESAGAIFLKKG